MIYCIGRNYVAHIAELQNAISDEMVIFSKPPTAILQDNTMAIPSFTTDLHYECELILRVGKTSKNLVLSNALDCIDAISIGIDFTARDIQSKLKQNGLPWEKAKAFDHSAVIGKWISPKENTFASPILFSLQKNKKTVQQGNTSFMLYNIQTILVGISQFFTLQQGDIIFTGTPEGVGKVHSEDVYEGFLLDQQLFQVRIA